MFLELQSDGTASNTSIIWSTKGAMRDAIIDVQEEKHETELYLELPDTQVELVCQRKRLSSGTSVTLALHATPSQCEEIEEPDIAPGDDDTDCVIYHVT